MSRSISEVTPYLEVARRLLPSTTPTHLIRPVALLVPHAGYYYSGLCAGSAYNKVVPYREEIREVILLCTHHFGARDDGVIAQERDPTLFEREHSYGNNISFIREVLPGARVRAFLLGHATPVDGFGDEVARMVGSASGSGTLLVGTTDLTHFGAEYRNTEFGEVPQSDANAHEDRVITGLVNGDPHLLAEGLRDRRVNACGRRVLQVMTHVANRMGWTGVVTCYHDSVYLSGHHVPVEDRDRSTLIDMMAVAPRRPDAFVRYVAVVFGVPTPATATAPQRPVFEDLYLLSVVRSVVENGILRPGGGALRFPTWTPWSRRANGVFVTVRDPASRGGRVRACIGRYETPGRTTMQNCIVSAEGCIADAETRWRRPLRSTDVGTLVYEVSLLEPEAQWREFPATDVARHYHRQDNSGIILHIPRRGNESVATFLPSVWQEHPEWSVEDLMAELSEKATGDPEAWRSPGSRVRIYRTETLTT